jgi:PP-loop superfamily ATP-utilizing enzyme
MDYRMERRSRLLITKMNKALRDYPMLSDGDRVAVAVSGGHDSLSLLHLLKIRQSVTPEHYDLVAIHIMGDARGPGDYPGHEPLLNWLAASGLEYAIEPMRMANGEHLPMDCQRCTWNRRSTLFQVAHRLSCNKVALGHHFDDIGRDGSDELALSGQDGVYVPIRIVFRRSVFPDSPSDLRDQKRTGEFCPGKRIPGSASPLSQ